MTFWILGFAIVILALWGLTNPFAGLLGLLLVYVTQPGELYPVFGAMHVERVMAIIVFLSFMVHTGRMTFPPISKRLFGFYAAVIASVPLSFWRANALINAFDFGKTVIYCLLIINLVNNRKRFRIFLLTFIGLISYQSVSSLINYYFYGGHYHAEGIDRIVGLTSSTNAPDTLGLTMLTALPIMLLFTLSRERRIQLLSIGAAVLALWALIFTGSRGTLLTLLIVGGVFVVTRRRRFIMVPVAAVVLMVGWWLMPAQYQERYTTQMQSDQLKNDAAYQNRITSWIGGWHMFLSNPITGIGIGDYTDANGGGFWPARKKIYLDAHSLYFKLIGELGLLGLITFAIFVGAVVKENGRLKRELSSEDVPPWMKHYPTAANLIIASLLVSGYASHDLYRDTWYVIAGLTAALAMILEQERREKAPQAAPLDTGYIVPAEATLAGGVLS